MANLLTPYKNAVDMARRSLASILQVVDGSIKTPARINTIVEDAIKTLKTLDNAHVSIAPLESLNGSKIGSISETKIQASYGIALDFFVTMNYLRPGLLTYLQDEGWISSSVVAKLRESQFFVQSEQNVLVNVISDIVDRDHDDETAKQLALIFQTGASILAANQKRAENDTKRWVLEVQMLKKVMLNGGNMFTKSGAAEGWADSLSAKLEGLMSDVASTLTAEIDQVTEIDVRNRTHTNPQNNTIGIDPNINILEYLYHYTMYN